MSQGSLIMKELVQVTFNYIQVSCQLSLKSYWFLSLKVTFYRSILWFLSQISLFPSPFYQHPCSLCYSSCLFCPVFQHLSWVISDLNSVFPEVWLYNTHLLNLFMVERNFKTSKYLGYYLKSIILVSCGCCSKLPQT